MAGSNRGVPPNRSYDTPWASMPRRGQTDREVPWAPEHSYEGGRYVPEVPAWEEDPRRVYAGLCQVADPELAARLTRYVVAGVSMKQAGLHRKRLDRLAEQMTKSQLEDVVHGW